MFEKYGPLPFYTHIPTLMKKKIKFSSHIRKFRMEQVAKSFMTNGLLIQYMVKYLRISSYIRKPFLIYDFASAPL
jgi:hypothetical protein